MNKQLRNNYKMLQRIKNKPKLNKLRKVQRRQKKNKKRNQVKKSFNILRHMSTMMKKMIKNE